MAIFPFGETEFVVDKDSPKPLAPGSFGNLEDILLVGTFKVWLQMFVLYCIVSSHPLLLISFFKCSRLNYLAFHG